MAALDNERLGLVFATRPDIIEGIKQAAGAVTTSTLLARLQSWQACHDPRHTDTAL